MSLGWTILLSALFLLAIIVGSNWYMTAMMNLLFVKKHREIDEILASGQPPQAWQTRYQKKLCRLQASGASGKRIARVTRAQRRRTLAGLERLARYVKKTNLVEDEAARSNALAQLRQCGQQVQCAEDCATDTPMAAGLEGIPHGL